MTDSLNSSPFEASTMFQTHDFQNYRNNLAEDLSNLNSRIQRNAVIDNQRELLHGRQHFNDSVSWCKLGTDFSTQIMHDFVKLETDSLTQSLFDVTTTNCRGRKAAKMRASLNSKQGCEKNDKMNVTFQVHKALGLDEELSNADEDLVNIFSENDVSTTFSVPERNDFDNHNAPTSVCGRNYSNPLTDPSSSNVLDKSESRKQVKKLNKDSVCIQKCMKAKKSHVGMAKKSACSEEVDSLVEKQQKKVKKSHLCSQCPMSFPFPSGLKRHIRTHLGIRPYACNLCERDFAQKCNLVAHVKTHRKYQECKSPKKKLASNQLVDGNQDANSQTQHGKEEQRKTNKMVHCCPHCSRSFSHDSKLKRHVRWKHTGVKPYACEVCPREFSEKCSLVVHMQCHMEDKPHACSACGRAFSFRSNLTRHLATHVEQTCRVCRESFSSKRKFVFHMRSHTKKSYDCDVCGKVFNKMSGWKRHMRIHLNERPYACDSCDYKAVQFYHLKRHKERHHAKIRDNNDSPPHNDGGELEVSNHSLGTISSESDSTGSD